MKTWREKMHNPALPKIVRLTPRQRRRLGGARTLLIPRPADVERQMRRPRRGRLITQQQIRDALARRARADAACPITTGIFIRIAAEAAEEDRRAGKHATTAYWRTLRPDGRLVDKLPGGVARQARRLREEGHTIRDGRVVDFERRLTT